MRFAIKRAPYDSLKYFLRKFLASFVTISYLLNFIIFPAYALTPTENQALTQTPTQSLAESQAVSSEIQTPSKIETSQDFLQDELTLEAAPSAKENVVESSASDKPAEKTEEIKPAEENNSFENILAELNRAKDFAVAALKQINLSNLIKLGKQAYEFGLTVIKGGLLVFTSHEANQLSVTDSFKKLFDQGASFMAHFQVRHGAVPAMEQPSAMDRKNALPEEHVASIQSDGLHVITYGPDSIDAQVHDGNYLVDKINAAIDPSQAHLDEIISEIQTVRPIDPSLTPLRSDPPTPFPGAVLGNFASSAQFGQPQGFITVTQTSAADFRMDYNLSNDGSFAGAIINFNNTAPPYFDFSSYSKFTFEMRTDNSCMNTSCLKIEFVDSSNRMASVEVQGLTGSFQQFDIPKIIALQNNPNVNFGQIKQINIVEDKARVAAKPVGFVEVRTGGGLYFTPPVSPSTGTVTDLTAFRPQPNALEPAGYDTVSGFSQPSENQFSFNYNLANGVNDPSTNTFTKWAGALLSFSPTPFNLSSQDLLFQLRITNPQNGTPTKLKIEVVSGTGPSAKKVTLIAQNVTSSPQTYRITNSLVASAQVSGFTSSNITAVNFIIDEQLAPPTGTGTIIVDTKGLNFIPTVAPDPTKTAANISYFPNIRGIIPFNSTAPFLESTVSLSEISRTRADLSYDVRRFGSFGGLVMSFDDLVGTPNTIETENLSGQNIVIGLKDPAGPAEVTFLVEDNLGRKARVRLTGINATEKFFTLSMTAALFPGVDLTRIKNFALVLESDRLGTDVTAFYQNVLFEGASQQPAPAANGDIFLADWNKDNIPDLITVLRQQTGSGKTEIHIWNGADNYQTALVHQATGLATTGSNYQFQIVDWNKDGVLDLAAIQLSQTGSGKTEVQILNGATGFQNFMILTDTALAPTGNNYEFHFFDWNKDNTNDLIIIQKNQTGSGKTEVQILNGVDSFKTFLLLSPTAFPETGDNYQFDFKDWNGDGTADLIILQENSTGSGSVEVHVLSGSSNFQTFILNSGSSQTEINKTPSTKNDYDLSVLDWDRDGRLDLVALKKDHTANGLVELRAVSGAGVLKKSGLASTLSVRIGDPFTPAVSPTNYSQAALTNLPANPVLAADKGAANNGTANGTITLGQTSPRDFSFTYTNADADDFEYAQIGWGFFNASNVFVGTPQNLGTSLTFAVTGGTGGLLKAEVIDKNKKTATFLLALDGTKKNYTLTLAGDNIPAGFDTTQIGLINFVVDQKKMGNAGGVTIETKGLDFIPAVNPAAYSQAALTNLPASPVLAADKGASSGGTANGTINLGQTSPRDFSFTYTNADADDFEYAQIGWGFFNASNVFVGTPQNLGTSLTFAVTGGLGGQLKVEVVDKNKKVADFYLNLDGTKKNYTLTLAGDNIPAGFDTTQIGLINFVVDQKKMGSAGGVTIETKGLDFIAPVNPAAYSQAALTSLPANPILSSNKGAAAGGTANGSITQTQTSPRDFSFDYTNADADDFAFSQIGWGFFNTSNVFVGTPQDLSAGIVLAVTGPAGKQLKVEVVDKNGKVADFLLNLDGTKKNYTLTLTGDNIPALFDATKIGVINLVVDQKRMGNSGTVTVETKGLDFAPIVNPAAYSQAALTSLPANPILSSNKGAAAGGTANGSITQTQTSPRDFSFDYTNVDADDFAFSQIGWGFFDAGNNNAFVGSPQNLSAGITLAVTGPAGKQLKVEVVDKNGRVADFLLNLDGTKKNYTLSLTGDNIPALFDATQIGVINLVVDQKRMGNAGTVIVETKGLNYIPPINPDATNPAVTDLSAFRPQPNELEPAGHNTVSEFSQPSENQFQFKYDLSQGADGDFSRWGGALMSFSTTPFNLAAQDLIFQIKATGTQKIKIELISGKDFLQKKVTLLAQNISGTSQSYRITKALADSAVIAGFDASNITFVNFVVDDQLAGTPGAPNKTATGTITIDTKGLAFIPSLAPDPTKTAADISHLRNPDGTLIIRNLVSFTSTDPFPTGIAALNQSSMTQFDLSYDVRRLSSFGGTIISFDDFGTAAIEHANLSGQTLVLGLKDPAGPSEVTFLIEDTAGRKGRVRLTGIDATERFFSIGMTAAQFPGIDLTQIKNISLVLEADRLGSNVNALYQNVLFNGATAQIIPADKGDFFIADWNNDKIPDLVMVLKQSTGSGKTEVHVWNGADNYQTALVHTATAQGEMGKEAQFQMVDWNKDGILDLAFILTKSNPSDPQNHTGSGKTEVHILNGADSFKTFLANLPTALPEFDYRDNRYEFHFVDWNRDGVQDLGFVQKSNTGSNKTEVHIMNGADKFQTFLVNSATALPKVGDNYKFDIKDWNGDGTPDFIAIKENQTGSGSTELHAWSGADFFQTDLLHTATAQGEINKTPETKNDYDVAITDWDGDGKLDLVAIKKDHTANNFVELRAIGQAPILKKSGIASTLSVRFGDNPFTPVVDGSPFNAALHTSLNGNPVVSAAGGTADSAPGAAQGTGTITQDSPRHFNFNYDVSAGNKTFAFAQISNGFFEKTVAEGGTCNPSAPGFTSCFNGDAQSVPQNLVIGVKGPAGSRVKVEIVDTTGAKGLTATFILNLTGNAQNYTLDLSGDNIPQGFDRTKIAVINFVMDQGLAANGTANPANTGIIEVTTVGLDFIVPVDPAAYSQAALTTLPANPVLSSNKGAASGGTADGSITQTQTSPRDFSFDYTNADADDFAFSQIGWGFFDAGNNNAFVGSPQNLSAGIVLAVTGPAGKQLKVEVVDKNGRVADFLLNLDGTKKNYTLTLTGDNIPALFDATQIGVINLVVDQKRMGNSGTVTVETKGLDFLPAVNPAAYDQAAITNLPGRPVLSANKGSAGGTANGSIVQTQTSPRDFSFDYTNVDADDFEFSQIGWGFFDASNNNLFVGPPQDLSGGITFAVTGPAGRQLKVEVVDQNSRVADFLLNLDGTKKNYTLTLTGDNIPAGFDATKIGVINFVMDQRRMGNSGTVAVETSGLDYFATVNPDPTNPAITPMPVTSTGERPSFTGFASQTNPDNSTDYSQVIVTQNSPTAALIDFNLYNTTSFGGAFLNYDNFSTTGTIETINLNTLFPNGIVLGLDNNGSDVTHIKLELTDINGVKNVAFLEGIDSVSRRWKITLDKFINVDLTKIKVAALVLEGRFFTGQLNVDWGNFAFVPTVNSDPTNPAITKVPATSTGERPTLTGFASQTNPDNSTDYSHVDVTTTSPTMATLDFNLYNTTSFGGAFLGYDNFSTTGTIETINLNTFFPNGIVFGLDTAGSLNDTFAFLEVTDNTGKRDRVKLTQIGLTQKRWKILISQFDEVDVAKIKTIAFLVEGRAVGMKLTVNWGDFNFVPIVASDPSNPAITKMPATSTGERPTLTGFASLTNPDNSTDYSNVSVTQTSATAATVDFNLYNTTSFGGAFLSYDNFNTTGTIETINLSTLFPDGIVLGLDNGGTAITEAAFEITDINGIRDRVRLTGIGSSQKHWKVLVSQFDQVDVTKIQSVTLVVEGRYVGMKLNVDWGDFAFVPRVNSDPTNPAITKVPVTSTNERPTLTGFASQTNPDNSTDYSHVDVTQTSASAATLDFSLYNTTSFGGVFFSYDNFNTGAKESIDLNTAFPDGIVLGLDNGGTAITEAVLEVTDINGIRDRVKLLGIDSSQKRWKVLVSQFDQVDVTKIQTIALLLEGRYVGMKLNLEWGDFAYIPVVDGTSFNEPAVSTLNGSPSLSGSGFNSVIGPGQQNAGLTFSQPSVNELEYIYDLSPSPTSFTLLQISKGGFDQNNVFQGTAFNLPENFVIAARGHEGSKLRLELMDVNHHIAVFILNLRPAYQNYSLVLSGTNVPVIFDRTQIASIIFVADRKLAVDRTSDIVKVKINGLEFGTAILPAPLQEVKNTLISKGLTFFTTGKGLDPATHFPYDGIEANGLPDATSKFTQPTSIGFYLQILSEVVNGTLSNGMTVDQALSEINTVMTNLLTAQTDFGWNGLLPWMTLEPALAPRDAIIGLGDNANLAQSLALAAGALEQASLTSAQRTSANVRVTQMEQFLNNQAPGYAAFVDPAFGIFRAVFARDTLTSQSGIFDGHIDRLANEFRGPVAFLKIRYPNLPSTVWTGLVQVTSNYTDRNNTVIKNLAYYDGGAFQAFWPLLRNNERDFLGFRNALDNAFTTFTDYSFQNKLPGFISASQNPDINASGSYFGVTGIREMAEDGATRAGQFLVNNASTYALASAFSIDPFSVLNFLNVIEDQNPDLTANEGFYDAARSNTEIAKRILAIDVGSTILGLSGNGPKAFEVYLRNRNLELNYNLLYDQVSGQLGINKTAAILASPPQFPGRSLSVFHHFSSEGTINNFPLPVTTPSGVRFIYGALAGGFGGKFWTLDQNYNARANQLIITYASVNTPQSLKIELKDENDQLVMPAITVNVVDTTFDKKIVINLPDTAALSAVRSIFVVIDQNATLDTSGDFTISAIEFQHIS
ncbi:MAG: VCBS repeat-containing protein [Candidatus Omnitrophica bacterium]|nr:VCBS repeat-containing protein [Candidatus Omnitrophota bacterium]